MGSDLSSRAEENDVLGMVRKVVKDGLKVERRAWKPSIGKLNESASVSTFGLLTGKTHHMRSLVQSGLER